MGGACSMTESSDKTHRFFFADDGKDDVKAVDNSAKVITSVEPTQATLDELKAKLETGGQIMGTITDHLCAFLLKLGKAVLLYSYKVASVSNLRLWVQIRNQHELYRQIPVAHYSHTTGSCIVHMYHQEKKKLVQIGDFDGTIEEMRAVFDTIPDKERCPPPFTAEPAQKASTFDVPDDIVAKSREQADKLLGVKRKADDAAEKKEEQPPAKKAKVWEGPDLPAPTEKAACAWCRKDLADGRWYIKCAGPTKGMKQILALCNDCNRDGQVCETCLCLFQSKCISCQD
jgi:hypothetical protein